MDVLRIPDNPLYFPDLPIEGYTSMIWTERFFDHGEFEMVHPDPTYARNMMPEGTFLTLIDTKEVMVVESNEIDEDDDGIVSAKISGRTLSSILESRTIGAELTVPANAGRYLVSRPSADRIALLIYDAIVVNPLFPTAGYEKSPYDLVPNCDVTNTIMGYQGYTNPLTEAIIEMGTMWSAIQAAMIAGNLGLRTIRPPQASAVTYIFSNANSGTDNPTYHTAIPNSSLVFDIYDGQDRTADVRFDVGQGTIGSPQYLFSIKDFKNTAYVRAPWGNGYWVYPLSYTPGIDVGFDRRTMFIDGTSWSDIGAPTSANLNAVRDRARQILLKSYNKLFFDGKVSTAQGKNYYDSNQVQLGQLVTLVGDYGVEQAMQVIEYIRAEDVNGDTAYPTLAVPNQT